MPTAQLSIEYWLDQCVPQTWVLCLRLAFASQVLKATTLRAVFTLFLILFCCHMFILRFNMDINTDT